MTNEGHSRLTTLQRTVLGLWGFTAYKHQNPSVVYTATDLKQDPPKLPELREELSPLGYPELYASSREFFQWRLFKPGDFVPFSWVQVLEEWSSTTGLDVLAQGVTHGDMDNALHFFVFQITPEGTRFADVHDILNYVTEWLPRKEGKKFPDLDLSGCQAPREDSVSQEWRPFDYLRAQPCLKPPRHVVMAESLGDRDVLDAIPLCPQCFKHYKQSFDDRENSLNLSVYNLAPREG